MAKYSANYPNRTLTLHKDSCVRITKQSLKSCGCGTTGEQGNQEWWCEDHINIEVVKRFMNSRFWAILLCDVCYGLEKN